MQGRRGEFAFALFLLGVGITVIVGALQVHAPATANVVGPRIAPLAVGVFVTALAAITVGTVIRHIARDRSTLAAAPTRGGREAAARSVARHGEGDVEGGLLPADPVSSGSVTETDRFAPSLVVDAPPESAVVERVGTADAEISPTQDDGPVDIATIAWCCVIMVAFGFALTAIGFLFAAFGLFVGLARVLGSRRWITDLVVSAAVASALYFGFTYVLGVALPAGLI